MDDVQTNQLGRAQKVNQFLKEKAAQLTSTPELNATLQGQLDTGITKAFDSDSHAVEDDSGETTTKSEARTALEDSSDHCGSGLVSLADDTDDFVTMQMFDFAISDLQHFRDSRLLEYAKSVKEKITVTTTAAALAASHNVSTLDINEHTANIAAFEDDIATPLTRKAERTAWGKQVNRDIAAVNATLDKIRRKMRTYRKTNRLLYETFLAIDTVDDYGHGASGGTLAGPVSAGEIKPVAVIDPYNTSATATLRNTSVAGNISYAVYKAGVAQGTALVVAPGTSVNTTLGTLAADGDALYVINSTGAACSYSVTL